MQYVRVTSEKDLLAQLAHPGTAILCGGTDLIVKMRAGMVDAQRLADVSGLAALRGISEENGTLVIGAAEPEETLLQSPRVRERLPLLADALAKLGSVQIRTRGSLGGNLVNASPAADSAIPLLLYDAQIELVGPAGQETVPLRDFFVGPGRTTLSDNAYVRCIRVPTEASDWIGFFHKVGKRQALTISIASLGALAHVDGGRIDDIRIAAGSVAPTPIRLDAVENLLRGQPLDDHTIDRARKVAEAAVSPIDDVRASAAYRREVIGELLVRFLTQLREG